MPYASDSDVPSYVPGHKKAQWREVWNSAHARAKKKGKSDKEAEAEAFREANGVAGPKSKADVLSWEIAHGIVKVEPLDELLKMKTKIAKDAVAYMGPEFNYKGCDFTCSGCVLWVTTAKCRILNPVDAAANEGCTFYTPGDPTDSEDNVIFYRAVPAAIAGLAKGPFTCKRCEHEGLGKDGTGECERVQGEIQAKACCNAWDNDKAQKAESEMPLQDVNAPDARKLRFNFAITKTDAEKREIEGLATAEICDTQGEVLTYEGSKEALKNWAGNVREMHQPKAVGRGLQISFNDDKREIIVRTRVSKGAADTWEKVLDGTLTHYSVGGEREVTTLKKADEVPDRCFIPGVRRRDSVRWTEKWRMTELSLVDSGAVPTATFALVKEVDGEMTETDVLANEPPSAVIEKKPLSSAARKNLPDSAFGYVDENGKGHYPIKTPAGKCDPNHVSNALSRAAAAKKKGGKTAEIASKAMPKIKACAKKLKIGAFAEKAELFVLTHNISKVEYQDGVCFEVSGEKKFFDPKEILEMTKDYAGAYATSFSYSCVDFETAYARYSQSANAQRQWDMVELLKEVIVAIMMDPDDDLEAKKGLVAESTEQFVSIFFEEAEEAAADEEENESEKLDKGDKTVPTEAEIKAAADKAAADAAAKAAAASAPPAFDAAEFSKSLLGSVKEALAGVQGDVKKVVDEAVKPLTERITKLEAQPALKADGKPVIRMAEKDGTQLDISKNPGGEYVLVDAEGKEFTKASAGAKCDELEKAIAALPLGDSRRTPLEIEYMKISRVRKMLNGDGIWK